MKQHLSHYSQIEIGKFAFGLALYLIISWLTFQLTSFLCFFTFYQIFGLLFFLLILIISYVILFVLRLKGQNFILVDKFLLYLLLIYQLIYLLLNVGDCGDNGGGYTFIETVVKGGENHFCFAEKSMLFPEYLMLFMPIIYIVLLIAMLTKCFNRKVKTA